MSVLAAAAAALGLASTAYQATGEARDRRENPPPGRLVDVGGYRLHIMTAGHGSPAVVVIPALGSGGSEWLGVQQAIARETAGCVYDRAGLGWSDSPLRRRSAATMAGELHGLLQGVGCSPPYVLVGHSLGGLVARFFIQRYRGEVAGLALIDSSHPGQRGRLPKTEMRDYPGGKLLEAGLAWARPLGLRRMARDLGLRQAADRDAAHSDWSCHRRADIAELFAFDAICREVTGGLGDLPLAVVTSSELDPNRPPASRAQRARSRFYRVWATLQDELSTLSTDSTHVVAEHAGHYVHLDDPELVTKAIIDLVRRARSTAH
jgi:pimeloyl-ACP methyl ester carboxylesterase